VAAVSSFLSALHAKVSLHQYRSSTLEALQRPPLGIFPVIDRSFVRCLITLSLHHVCWIFPTCEH
jgi:hypothetical protein